MEDFEYSVEICDRDWECFFAECEECNLLPPSLAGLDDSGMSDMDDAGSVLAQRARRAEPAACLPVTDRPIDGPPDCEGSPVEHYLSRHGVGGLESVLSGSEEDIHLRSVNLFFEGLKGLAEGKPPEPGKNREVEEEEEEGKGVCGDGRRASWKSEPKNIPELNCLPAKGETAVGKETMTPGGTMSHTNTLTGEVCESKTSSEPAPPQTHSSSSDRAQLSNTGSMSGATQWSRSDSEAETCLTKGGGLMSPLIGSERSGTDPTRNPDVKWKENPVCSRSEPASHESAASVKKRRRKKRRLSEGGPSSAKQSDSDEERYSSPGSLGSPDAAASFYSNEPQKNGEGSTRCSTAGTGETPGSGSTLSSSANGGTHSQESLCSSVSTPDQIRENGGKDADVATLHQPEPNGKCHSAEVRPVGPSEGRCQNDRLSAAKSGVAAEAGNSGEGRSAPRQTEAEPQQQLEIHCHNTDRGSALPEKVCPPPSANGAVASPLPHAKPQLKGGEHLFLNEASDEVLNDGSCVSSSLEERKEADVSPEGNAKDSPVKAELLKSNHEDSPSVSDVTRVSSARSLESIMSLSNENTTDSSASFSSSVSEGKEAADPEGGDQKCDLLGGAEESITSPPERGKNSVFAISSFWSEMEKLTINDILGLRLMSGASPPGFLPPLQESEETDLLTIEDVSSDPACVESNSLDLSPLKSVTWENEPVLLSQSADLYPGSATQTPPTIFAVKGHRKLSKNVSVHNLHALESESQTLDGEKAGRFTGSVPEGDEGVTASPPSLADSYSFSLTDIFQYLFSGKQSLQTQPAPENPVYSCGNSVPESYDHFFSEFDTESFFYPLIAAEDQEVPIFSCSRSANQNLQFPEAYDYFFKSSSSDDSSDEDEDSGPVRVVTRFSRKASSSQLSTDIYDNFFTDQEDFFWNTTFSFRNVNFPASTVQRQGSNPASLVPVRQHRTSLPRAARHLNVLGHQDVMFPDPLLGHLEERISRQLARRPFTLEDLQTVVSNPRLDAPFLPLRQSDMCMVCIAFASWVLKTANPQVGDAWKAVLLANVSALSAIQYLRRYVRVEAATGDTEQPEP